MRSGCTLGNATLTGDPLAGTAQRGGPGVEQQNPIEGYGMSVTRPSGAKVLPL